MERGNGWSDKASRGLLKSSWGGIVTRRTAEGENRFQRHFREDYAGLSDHEGEGAGSTPRTEMSIGGRVDKLLTEPRSRSTEAGRWETWEVSLGYVEREVSGGRGGGQSPGVLIFVHPARKGLHRLISQT